MGTEDLIGVELDAAVARALGYTPTIEGDEVWLYPSESTMPESFDPESTAGRIFICEQFMPSRNWSEGGPIVERELIDVSWTGHPTKPTWTAKIYPDQGQGEGPTPLIAAMRAFVASKK
jgi:hypothetical protein